MTRRSGPPEACLSGAAEPVEVPDLSGPLDRGRVTILEGDNLEVIRGFADGSFTLVYLDPPFNTGRAQATAVETARSRVTTQAETTPSSVATRGTEPLRRRSPDASSLSSEPPAAASVVRRGFHGREYERLRGDLRAYDDRFDDYWGFLEPRLIEAWRLLADDGTLYLHLDYREAHYAKVLLDAVFGRDRFLNELIWAYDYGAKTRRRWPTKHDTILVYVKNPAGYWFDSEAVDREPYMAPGPRHAREGGARQAADRRLVAHDRADDGPREDRLPDAEARGHPAPDRAGVQPPGRPGARLLRRQRHDRCGRLGARPRAPCSSTTTPRRSR